MAPTQWSSDVLTTDDGITVPCSVIGEQNSWGVVLAHPHPGFGGDRHHPLLRAIGERVAAAGGWAIAPSLRADGAHESPPVGPLDDLRAAVSACHDATGRAPKAVGYSFGAGLITYLAAELSFRTVVLVAPPANMMRLPPPPADAVLFVGEHDTVVTPDSLAQWAPDHDRRVIAGTDHFLAGHIAPLADSIAAVLVTSSAAYWPTDDDYRPSLYPRAAN